MISGGYRIGTLEWVSYICTKKNTCQNYQCLFDYGC